MHFLFHVTIIYFRFSKIKINSLTDDLLCIHEEIPHCLKLRSITFTIPSDPKNIG